MASRIESIKTMETLVNNFYKNRISKKQAEKWIAENYPVNPLKKHRRMKNRILILSNDDFSIWYHFDQYKQRII